MDHNYFTNLLINAIKADSSVVSGSKDKSVAVSESCLMMVILTFLLLNPRNCISYSSPNFLLSSRMFILFIAKILKDLLSVFQVLDWAVIEAKNCLMRLRQSMTHVHYLTLYSNQRRLVLLELTKLHRSSKWLQFGLFGLLHTFRLALRLNFHGDFHGYSISIP